MKISVDVDGVLFDIMVPFCQIFNKRYNANCKKEDATRWDFFQDWKIPETEAYTIFYEIYENPLDVPLIDLNALNVLKHLNKIHHVDIVSARTQAYKAQLKEELSRQGFIKNIHYAQLILVGNSPKDIKSSLEYDIYIDDNPHLAESIKKMKGAKLLLYDQPWNRMVNPDKKVKRVHNWTEIGAYFDQLNE
ncbi:MAG: hypothetical protein BAJALOKI1v1_1990002 [Promethearchaeota archaeon]|nr:MAG: hypothetical protein BAJALOKI1v1_1990002 [Candidatus Lokiarchaeota archaeon]